MIKQDKVIKLSFWLALKTKYVIEIRPHKDHVFIIYISKYNKIIIKTL